MALRELGVADESILFWGDGCRLDLRLACGISSFLTLSAVVFDQCLRKALMTCKFARRSRV